MGVERRAQKNWAEGGNKICNMLDNFQHFTLGIHSLASFWVHLTGTRQAPEFFMVQI